MPHEAPTRRSEGLRGLGSIVTYTGVIIVAEVMVAVGWVVPGAIVDAALVPVLLGHFVVDERHPQRKLFPILALVALLRVLSVTAAIPRLPEPTWYVTVGATLLAAEMLTVRFIDEPFRRLNLTVRNLGLDAVVTITGIPAGVVGYVVLRPVGWLVGSGPVQIVAGVITLVVFAAFVEELLFRGLLQSVASDVFGAVRLGVVYAAGLAGVMYLGSGSLTYTAAVTVYGLILGVAVARGGSLIGTTASHGLALVGMAYIWPGVLG